MISWKTLWVFLLTLLMGSGIAMWNEFHQDGCYRYMHGDKRERPTQNVEVNGEPVAVPCEQWFPRQTMYMQGACIAEGTLLAVFLMRATGDFVNWRRVKRGKRRLEE